MNLSTLIEKAKKGDVLPVYLLCGEEGLMIRRLCDAVRTAVVGVGPRGLAEDIFEGRARAAAVLNACRTLPMMAKRRLVTVRDVDQMAPSEQEALIPYLSKPEATTVLLLVGAKLDTRRRLALEGKKLGCLFESRFLDDAAAAQWISREAAARGLTMDEGAIESLVLSIGGDLGQLNDAIERLGLFTNLGPISAKTVDAVVTPVREIPAFDLAGAVAQRKRARALACVTRLLHQGQDPLPILGLLAWQLGQIARAKEFSARPPEGASLAQALKVPPGRVAAVQEMATKWSLTQLQRAFRVLAAADIALKGGRRLNDKARDLVAVEAVLALCGAPGLGEPAG